MTVAPCLHLDLRTKAALMYSIESDYFFLEVTIFLERKWRFWMLNESDNLFLEITIFWEQKNLKSASLIFLAPGPPFCKAITGNRPL